MRSSVSILAIMGLFVLILGLVALALIFIMSVNFSPDVVLLRTMDKTAAEESAVSTSSDDELEQETLLLPYYPPPPDLPTAQIVSEGDVESAADGIVLSAEWAFKSANAATRYEAGTNITWPEPTEIDSANSLVRFSTDVEPHLVLVEGFEILSPTDAGTDVGGHILGDYPAASYECSRFQSEPCMSVGAAGNVELHQIPADVFELPHVLVFAIWSVDEQDDPDGTATANWVFYTKAVSGDE